MTLIFAKVVVDAKVEQCCLIDSNIYASRSSAERLRRSNLENVPSLQSSRNFDYNL